MLYVYNERDPGRLNVQDCETFISSSDESELERFHFLIAAICVYIYNYVNSSFANVYIYIHLFVYGLLWFRSVVLLRLPRYPVATSSQHNLFLLYIHCKYKHISIYIYMCKYIHTESLRGNSSCTSIHVCVYIYT